MELKMFVKKNDWLPMMPHGWGNGYVIIPEGHPLHGKGYDDIDVEVHGGLTFSEPANSLDWDEIAPEDKGGWVIGFDTAHYSDTPNNWPKERVVAETEDLLRRVQEFNLQTKK